MSDQVLIHRLPITKVFSNSFRTLNHVMDTLQELWKPAQLESADLKCCHCGEPVTKDDTLIRTFALQPKEPPHTATANGKQHAAAIQVPWLSETILTFDRHFRCLLSSKTRYVTISHVWHPDVSKLQFEYTQALVLDNFSEDEIASVARLVREVPTRIYLGIVDSLKPEERREGLLEVWHDYISVPQWCHGRKGHIIHAIPELYSHAYFVVPFFSDLAPSSVQAMRSGSTSEERVRGVVEVCNSRWFRRIWTAMECVQSSQLRPMLQDYKLLDEFRTGLPFYDEPALHYEDEVHRTIRDHVVRLAGVGRNVLPHMLGPLAPVRIRRLRGLPVPFAHCFILISRRQATVPVDFIHALLGLTGPVVPFSELPHQDIRKSVSIIAKARLRAGDFSPLFIMPRKRDAAGIKATGFDEHGMFGLGMEESPPQFSGIVLSGPGESMAKLKVENLGTVTMAKRLWKNTDFGTFHELARRVLDVTGPDPDVFAETICCRFFGDHIKQVRENLDKENRRSQLQVHLQVLYDEYPGVKRRSATDYVAQLLMLNEAHKGNISPNAMDFSKSLGSLSVLLHLLGAHSDQKPANQSLVL